MNVNWRICSLCFPGGACGKGPTCQWKRRGFSPWVRKIPWRGARQPTPVFLPGESHGQRSLAGCSLWGRRELNKTEQLTLIHSGNWLSSDSEWGGRVQVDSWVTFLGGDWVDVMPNLVGTSLEEKSRGGMSG